MQGVQVLLVSLSCLLAITMVQAFRIMPTATFFKSVTTRSSTSNTVMNALKSPDDVSSFTEIVAPSDNNLGKYRLVGTLPGPVLAEYMEQYKAEFKKRKSSFSGFRPGYIPPYAMVDVRRYVICFGLESLITEACETNGLMVS